jgi:methylated-DNA-[protein]-cysteine S-methyltransferase
MIDRPDLGLFSDLLLPFNDPSLTRFTQKISFGFTRLVVGWLYIVETTFMNLSTDFDKSVESHSSEAFVCIGGYEKLRRRVGRILICSPEVAQVNVLQALNTLDPIFTENSMQEDKFDIQISTRSGDSGGVYYDSITHSLIGTIFIAETGRGLFAVDFGMSEDDFVKRVKQDGTRIAIRSSEKTAEVKSQLCEYLNGDRVSFDVNIDLSALSRFHQQVLMAAWEIPHGRIATYGEIARRIGKPKAARAVGQALSRNPVPIVIPCHRVIASDGSLGGYSGGGGLETKAKLLELENSTLL